MTRPSLKESPRQVLLQGDSLLDWFPRIIFYRESGTMCGEVQDTSLGDLFRCLKTMDNTEFSKTEPRVICSLNPIYDLTMGSDGFLQIIGQGPRIIAIDSQNAKELTEALIELG